MREQCLHQLVDHVPPAPPLLPLRAWSQPAEHAPPGLARAAVGVIVEMSPQVSHLPLLLSTSLAHHAFPR